MEHAHVVDSLIRLVETEDSVATSLADVEQLLVLSESQPSWSTEATQGQGSDTLLLHVDHEEGAMRVGG